MVKKICLTSRIAKTFTPVAGVGRVTAQGRFVTLFEPGSLMSAVGFLAELHTVRSYFFFSAV